MKILRISFALLLTCTALAAPAQPLQKNEQMTVDGTVRKFIIYIPSLNNTTDKIPVIISLHGRLGTGKRMMDYADFRQIAEREKFIIVCPDGINRSWNDGRATPAQKKGVDDVHFTDQLISYILATYPADAKRIYITGMSNGGFMASRLACELNDRIAAIAVVGASMDKGVSYHPAKALPVMYIQGSQDPLVPYNGGVVKGAAGGEVYGHKETLEIWVDADHCDPNPVTSTLPDKAHDGTTITKEEFTNTANGVKVIGYTINNGGHTWPGEGQYLPKFLVGTVSHNLDACQVIWDFFKGYRLGEWYNR